MSSARARIFPEWPQYTHQCIDVPLCCSEFLTVTSSVSPQSAMIVGPGYWLLMAITNLSTPSGANVVFVISRLYLRVMPLGGTLASKSVTMLHPLFQHDLVFGPLVHCESATRVFVACLGSRAKALGRAEAKVLNPMRRALPKWQACESFMMNESLVYTQTKTQE